MKRMLTLVFIILLLVSFVGCDTGENNNGYSEVYPQNDTNEAIDPNHPVAGDIMVSVVEEVLEFTSLLDFLETHRAYIMGSRSFGARTHLIERANFAGLGQIYLPVGIPETYRLYRIYVSDDAMSFWYMPEEDLVSHRSRTSAMAHGRDFTVSITRWNFEDPKGAMMGQLRGVSVHDLIDGRYYFDELRSIEWTTDTERVLMYIPRLTRNAQGEFEIGDETTGIITLRREEIPQLAQMQVLDLTNFAEVDALLATLPPSHYQLTFDMGVSQANAFGTSGVPLIHPASIDPIDIPIFANLRFFLHDNYHDLTATPVKEGHTFLGWYLDTDFTMPLASRDEYLMPTHDITLYARWEQATTGFTIRFNINANDGIGTMADITGVSGNVLFTNLPQSQFGRVGYIQIGWRQGHPRGAFLPLTGSFFMSNDDVTLYAEWVSLLASIDDGYLMPTREYAHWEQSTGFTIRFDGNGATSGSMANITGAPGNTLFTNLSQSQFRRVGHIQMGWRQGHPMGAFLPLTGPFFMPKDDVTLYAEWIAF